MILRTATMDDARRLFEWRNDPLTRAMSHTTSALDYDSHCAWLARSLELPSRTLYIAEANGEPVGTLRLDRVDGATELSWTVDPQRRQRGYGTAMVRRAAQIFSGPLIAQIKAENIASIRIAEAAGFSRVSEEGDVLHFARPATQERKRRSWRIWRWLKLQQLRDIRSARVDWLENQW